MGFTSRHRASREAVLLRTARALCLQFLSLMSCKKFNGKLNLRRKSPEGLSIRSFGRGVEPLWLRHCFPIPLYSFTYGFLHVRVSDRRVNGLNLIKASCKQLRHHHTTVSLQSASNGTQPATGSSPAASAGDGRGHASRGDARGPSCSPRTNLRLGSKPHFGAARALNRS